MQHAGSGFVGTAVLKWTLVQRDKPNFLAGADDCAPSQSESQQNSSSANCTKTYEKMLKCGIPRGAVEQKMRNEGVDPSLLYSIDLEEAVTAKPSSIDPPNSTPQSKRAVQEKMRRAGFDLNLLKRTFSARATVATEIRNTLRSLSPAAEDSGSEHKAAVAYPRAGNSKAEVTPKQADAERNVDAALAKKAIVAARETHTQMHAKMIEQITKKTKSRLKKVPSRTQPIIPLNEGRREACTASLEKRTRAQDMAKSGLHGRKVLQKASIIPLVDRNRLFGPHEEAKPVVANKVAQQESEMAVPQQDGEMAQSPPVSPFMKRLMEDLLKTAKSTATQSRVGEPQAGSVVRRPPPPPPRRLADASKKKATLQPMPAVDNTRQDNSHTGTVTARDEELSSEVEKPPSSCSIHKLEQNQDHAVESDDANVHFSALDGLEAEVVIDARHYSTEELEGSLARLETRRIQLLNARDSVRRKKKDIDRKLAGVAADLSALRDEFRLGATTEQLRKKKTYVDVLAAEVATVEANPSSEETRRVLEPRVEVQEDANWAKSLAEVHRDNVNAVREASKSAAQAGLKCAEAAVAELRESWATKINAHRAATAAAKIRASELKSRLETHKRLLDQRRVMRNKTDLRVQCEEAALREARAAYHQVAAAVDADSVFHFLDKLRQDRLAKSRQACDLLRAAAALLSTKARARKISRYSNLADINLRAELRQAPTTETATAQQ